MASQLKLTSEQKSQLKELLIGWQRQKLQLTGDLATQRFELTVLLDESKPNAEAVRAQARKVADLQASLAIQQIETVLGVKNILTTEQQEKLKTLVFSQQGPGGQMQQGQGRPGGQGQGGQGQGGQQQRPGGQGGQQGGQQQRPGGQGGQQGGQQQRPGGQQQQQQQQQQQPQQQQQR
jgi:Spy/CpxP family protein refolding chaperone